MHRILLAFLALCVHHIWCGPVHAAGFPAEATAEDRPLTAEELKHRSEEIARLSEEISKNAARLSERPKRKFISANVRQPEYRAYLERWKKKIEGVGNEHYPEEARRLKLSGLVVVTVSIGRDGQFLGAEVVKSSGSKILDDAAVAISELASPFPPIPSVDDIDILCITRTWDFD